MPQLPSWSYVLCALLFGLNSCPIALQNVLLYEKARTRHVLATRQPIKCVRWTVEAAHGDKTWTFDHNCGKVVPVTCIK